MVSIGAAVLGSMLGLGGGVFLVPIFTLFFGIDPKLAIGASAIAVVTNSVVGSTVHLDSRFTNLRLAMLLQIPTAAGALVGALLAVRAPDRILNGLFGAVLTYAAVSMFLRRKVSHVDTSQDPDPMMLGGVYHDPASQKEIIYVPRHVRRGLGISGLAGMLSGMLGVGGGVIQVPAMNLVMSIPVKAAAGTSALMVGMTAVATSFVFYADNKIDPQIVLPAMIGIFAGAQVGSRLTRKVRTDRLIILFVLILLYLGFRLIMEALNIDLPSIR
ncbi:MAG: sulfite exporter TauE/SafE family protein [Thermomicrobiales bacterium]|nr:sulfite exporter TauE/SafE family protein [Thermomicrobiales bacterium]